MPEEAPLAVLDPPLNQESEERKILIRQELENYQNMNRQSTEGQETLARLQVEYGPELIPEIIALTSNEKLNPHDAIEILKGIDMEDEELYFAAKSIANLHIVYEREGIDLTAITELMQLTVPNLEQLAIDAQVLAEKAETIENEAVRWMIEYRAERLAEARPEVLQRMAREDLEEERRSAREIYAIGYEAYKENQREQWDVRMQEDNDTDGLGEWTVEDEGENGLDSYRKMLADRLRQEHKSLEEAKKIKKIRFERRMLEERSIKILTYSWFRN